MAAPLPPPPSSMADFFAPNLEDGELWLPSDVFLEIASTNVNNKVQKNTDKKNLDFHNVHDHDPFLHGDRVYDDFTSFSKVSSPEMEIYDTLLGTKPINVKSPTPKRVPKANHNGYHRRHHPCWNYGFQVVSGPFHTYHPIIPTQDSNHGLKNKPSLFIYGKSEGTGVFLPRCARPPLKEYGGVAARGTGVFLNNQQIKDKNKNSGQKKVEGYEKKQFVKEEIEENKRSSSCHESQFIYEQICLPQEWTYSGV